MQPAQPPPQSMAVGYLDQFRTYDDFFYENALSPGPGHNGSQPAKAPPSLHFDSTTLTHYAVVNVALINSSTSQNDDHPNSVFWALSNVEEMAASGSLRAYLQLPANVDIRLRVWNLYGTRNVNDLSCSMIELLNRTGQPEHLICFMLGRLHHKIDVLRVIQEHSILHCMFPARVPAGATHLFSIPNIRPFCLDRYTLLQLTTALNTDVEQQFAGYIGNGRRNAGVARTLPMILQGNLECFFDVDL